MKSEISSNLAEKANDLVVASRQTHNSMSWSFTGSHALAVITAAILNGEEDGWLGSHNIRFSPRKTAYENEENTA